MARWSDRFTPIAIAPDEQKLLLKRESLRRRGFRWTVLAAWCLLLFLLSLCFSIVRRGWQADAEIGVRSVILLLVIFTLPGLLLLFSVWLDDSYTLSLQRLCPRQGLFSGLQIWLQRIRKRPVDAPTGGVECSLVWRATVEPLGWPARWFDVGNVVVATRSQARAVVLRHLAHPHLVAEEIMRYSLQAGGAGNASADAWPDRRYRPGLTWLYLTTLPGQLLLWISLLFWLSLRLAAWLTPDTGGTVLTIASVLTIPFIIGTLSAILQWYYCVYLVTDRRVVGRKGIFKVKQTDLRLEEVVSATVTESGFVRYLGIGTVQVNTAGHSGSVKMVDISEANLVRQVILDIQERLRQQRVQLEFGEIRDRLVRALRL